MAKDFQWQGKSGEELKALSMDEFLQMIPTRARRSLKRGLTDHQKALMKQLEAGKNTIKTHARDMVILPIMVDKTILVYTGKDFARITITPEMLGHKLGEFAHTRKNVAHSAAGVGATRSSKAISAR